MTIDDSINGLLEGGAKALSFPAVGTTHRGTILAATTTQQRDMDGKPKYWDDGNPAMQIVITLQTDYSEGADDDGTRRLFVKGQMLNALRTSLAGKKIEAGGEIAVQYHADGEPKQRGFNAPKLYKAAYRPPSPTAAVDDLLATPARADETFDPFLDR